MIKMTKGKDVLGYTMKA